MLPHFVFLLCMGVGLSCGSGLPTDVYLAMSKLHEYWVSTYMHLLSELEGIQNNTDDLAEYMDNSLNTPVDTNDNGRGKPEWKNYLTGCDVMVALNRQHESFTDAKTVAVVLDLFKMRMVVNVTNVTKEHQDDFHGFC